MAAGGPKQKSETRLSERQKHRAPINAFKRTLRRLTRLTGRIARYAKRVGA